MALSLIVFDCDGVILESVDAKTKAFGQVAEPLGAEARDRLLLYHTLHGGVSRRKKFAWLYREVFHREITPEEMEDCCARFVSYALDNVLNAPLVPGVMDVLERWHGRVPMYVCSGTPQEELQSVLEQRGLARYFTGICGTPPAKAELLKGIVRKERIDPADAVMVGDATTDSDAAEAADCAAAMARGLAGEGILPTFKHFPGHGDTAEDSHTGLAYSYRTVEELAACELLPFEAAAEVGPHAVMVGHIVVPELTGDLPATLCADAIALVPDAENTLIVTDSLAMGAITDSYTPGEAAVQALQAGCDVLLMPDGLADAYDAVLAAVQNGTVSEERLDLSVNKILRMKAQFCA